MLRKINIEANKAGLLTKHCPFDRIVGSRGGGFIMVGSASCIECRHNEKNDNKNYILCKLASACKYCEEDKRIFENDDDYYTEFGYFDHNESLVYHQITLAVFIDRGHLRFVNNDDTNCLEGGEKIKIMFCPFCGAKITDWCGL